MEKEILELRKSGKTYKEICQILKCSHGLVAYYCGDGQKEKQKNRQRKWRADNVIINKVENFQVNRKLQNRKLKDKTEDFQRDRIIRNCKNSLGKRNITFRWKDVIEKFGWETTCYLTGRKINLEEPKTYNFDHIIPIAKGGESTLANLGICCRDANMAKNDMYVDELLDLCKEILEHNGFNVSKE